MTCKPRGIEEFSLPLPITEADRTIAQEFAAQQPTPEKAEQVHRNTLAVCVVNYYLQMIGIPTNLKASDSWNSVVRLCSNVADLEVVGLGRLECRPIAVQEQSCYIPPEVWSDRIGYVVVQFDELFREASVLGFAQTAAMEYLPISELQPLEDLLDTLSQLRQPIEKQNFASLQSGVTSQTLVNLRQWLQGVLETGWQAIELLSGPAQSSLAFSFRRSDYGDESNHLQGGIKRAKLIDLGMQLAGHPVALIVELRPESAEQKTDIVLQVHPTGSQIYLPPLLQLIVIDEFQETFLEAQARSTDNYIQLQFSAQPGERFSVKVALGDVSITENFVI